MTATYKGWAILKCQKREGVKVFFKRLLTTVNGNQTGFLVNSKFQFSFFLNPFLEKYFLSYRVLPLPLRSLPSPFPSLTHNLECNGCHFSFYLSICSHDQQSQSSPYFASSMRILFILGLF